MSEYLWNVLVILEMKIEIIWPLDKDLAGPIIDSSKVASKDLGKGGWWCLMVQ